MSTEFISNFINNALPLVSSSVTLLTQKDEISKCWNKRDRRKKFASFPRQYKGFDYEQLINWLLAQEWEAANQETQKIVLLLKKDIASATILGNWGIEYLFKQHHQHLFYIDNLWMAASNNHFGFTPQLDIWKLFRRVIDWRTFYQLTDSLGWTASQKLKELKFSVNTPKGHLPTLPFARPFHEYRVRIPLFDNFTKELLIKNPPVLCFLDKFDSLRNNRKEIT